MKSPKPSFYKKLNREPLVAASIGKEKSILNSARKATKDGADLIELRVDLFARREIETIEALVREIRQNIPLPLIGTVRHPKEQGKTAVKNGLSDFERKKIFEVLIPLVDCVDIELESHSINKEMIALARKKNKKVILSYHDFKSVPSPKKIEALAKEFRSLCGDIFKIAAAPKTQREMSQFLSRCSQLKLPYKIFIAMGEIGKISRLSGFALGSCITYGSVSKATAPGQLSVKELSDYRKIHYAKI